MITREEYFPCWELIWPAAGDTATLTGAWDALTDRFEARRGALGRPPQHSHQP